MACRSITFSVSEQTEYLIGAIIATELMNKKTHYNPSEIVRHAVANLVETKYPQLMIKEN